MKRPKKPRKWAYWYYILHNGRILKEFMSRGNGRQRKELKQARKYFKWCRIHKGEEK